MNSGLQFHLSHCISDSYCPIPQNAAPFATVLFPEFCPRWNSTLYRVSFPSQVSQDDLCKVRSLPCVRLLRNEDSFLGNCRSCTYIGYLGWCKSSFVQPSQLQRASSFWVASAVKWPHSQQNQQLNRLAVHYSAKRVYPLKKFLGIYKDSTVYSTILGEMQGIQDFFTYAID